MQTRTIAGILIFVLCCSGCDVIDSNYKTITVNPVDTTKHIRKILLEDFTGFRCNNCPEATELATLLQQQYSKQLIIVSIHAGPLARPTAKAPYDFRTPEGNALFDYFQFFATPLGMVNRVQNNGERTFTKDAWATLIEKERLKPAPLTLTLQSQYNTTTRAVQCTVIANYLLPEGIDNYLVVQMIENGVIQYQEDYRRTPPEIQNYEHNHVLRAGINGTFGEVLSSKPIQPGDGFVRAYSFTLKPEWNAERCKLIVYVHKHKTSSEILQVEEFPLISR